MNRILVVDDNPRNVEILTTLLRAHGHQTTHAYHGAEALALARQHPPDLVISDLLMPVMDGYMLLHHWRFDDRLTAIPFLVYTATYTDPKDEQLAYDLGADAFLVKPADPEVIIAQLHELFEQRPVSSAVREARANRDTAAALQAYCGRVGDKLQRKQFELAQARQALRETDDLYSSLFENNHAVMLLVDPREDAIVDANPAACAFYGWSRDALRRKRIDEINTLSADDTAAEMRRAQRGDRRHFEFRHRLADGSVRDVEVYSGPILVRGRELLYSIVHDVTTRREAQRELERNVSLTRIASSLAQVGGWEVDLAENRVYWCEEVCRIHGLPEGTMVTVEQGIDFCAPLWRERIRTVFAACANHGVPYDEELQIVAADGRLVWVRMQGAAVRDANGAVRTVHGAIQDISDRVATQERLRQLWLAVEQSPESIVITDLEPRIEYVNQAFCDVSGYTRAELIGQNPRILSSGKTPRERYEAMWAALTAGNSWRGEFCNRRKDGSEYIEMVSASPVRQEDGRITNYLALKEEVTEKLRIAAELDRHRHHLEEMVEQRTRELIEARREAESANQAKSAFLANMSHEIRTPMNGVLGMVEVLARQPLSDEQAELVETIRESGKALLVIIEDVLDFSKIEAGRMELEAVPVSLGALTEGLCESLSTMARTKGVDLRLFVSPLVPERVLADEVRLRQILFNLIGNAIKFSGGRPTHRGRVELRIEVAAPSPLHVAFRVVDNGIGMDPEMMGRLFQPFSQAEQATTRRFGGTGLGLTICKSLVELMRGEILADSIAGRGTTFTVTLPLEACAQQPTGEHPDLHGICCIVVEDEELNAGDLVAYLEHAGAQATRVLDLDAARDAVLRLGAGDDPVVLVRHVDFPNGDVPAQLAGIDRLRHLHIHSGRRQHMLGGRGHVFGLDGTIVRRGTLLQTVAMAAGRFVLASSSGPAERLPLASAAQKPSIAEARARGELILVAEDDVINQKVIVKQLELLGRACDVAANGAEALALWRGGRYALLLTDLHMPEMDGYMLTEAIRREEALRAEQSAGEVMRLPILALTATALRGEAEHAQAIGMDDYLSKPLQLRRLDEALKRWLP